MKAKIFIFLWRALILTAFALLNGQATANAEAPFYTLALQWPKNSNYALDLRNNLGTQIGITLTPVLQFQGNYRQTAIVVPELAACTQDTRLQLTIQALQATQHANLTITSEHQVIYQQTINHSITTLLPGFDPETCIQRTDAIVGEVTLAVAKPFNEATLSLTNLALFDVGHAWIEFRALSSTAPVAFATVGTYSSVVGDNVVTGINFFREVAKMAHAHKTQRVNQQQLNQLIAVIDHFQALGTTAWTPWQNCTAFAIAAWQAVSGENLSATIAYKNAPWEVTQLGLPNSTSLYYAILAAGGSTN